MLLVGDLNARVATPTILHKVNPDTTVNSHGRKLLKLCKQHNFNIINGMNAQCDSNFTFFRGKTRSQNDICLTNDNKIIKSFKILKRFLISDHSPCEIVLNLDQSIPLDFVENLSKDLLNDNHYDRYHSLKPIMKLKKLDTTQVAHEFNKIAAEMDVIIDNNCLDTAAIAEMYEHKIYDACRENKKVRKPIKDNSIYRDNRNSHNLQAIAEMNFYTFNVLMDSNASQEEYIPYLEQYNKYRELAIIKQDEEFNTKTNNKWKNMNKNDTKKLWQCIDWKDKHNDIDGKPSDEMIDTYFRSIFQSTKICNDPTTDNSIRKINDFELNIPLLDDNVNINEFNLALKEIGNGTGYDGIHPTIVTLFTPELKDGLVKLLNKILGNTYPDIWKQQLLISLNKKGSTTKNPKLRGIAISSILPKILDIILNNRFNMWFKSNATQAGYKKSQGCLLQIFGIILMIELANSVNKSLFLGLLDYEKAFDYINRSDLIDTLMLKGAGKRFVKTIHGMYDRTVYTPKISASKVGNQITARYGVTQGRKTSANFFTFSIDNMPANLSKNDELFREVHVLQLADDTALPKSSLSNLKSSFVEIMKYSESKYMHINFDKTHYLHLVKSNQITEDIIIGDIMIKSASKNQCLYLGMLFTNTNDIKDLIIANLKHRAVNKIKFYNWLDINIETSIVIKLRVLDSCMYSSMLYGCEVWWRLEDVKDELLKEEREILKRILGVKRGTSNDHIYIELSRPDIVSRIKDRQYNFFSKILLLPEEDAIVKQMITYCKDLPICEYYNKLINTNKTDNINNRRQRVVNSQSSMDIRYTSLCDENFIIYNSFLPEKYRITLTRWRLSCFKLRIETGRYDNTSRNDRLCRKCDLLQIEDEEHVLIECSYYNNIRATYNNILAKYESAKDILNPKSTHDASMIAKYIIAIEKRHDT